MGSEGRRCGVAGAAAAGGLLPVYDEEDSGKSCEEGGNGEGE